MKSEICGRCGRQLFWAEPPALPYKLMATQTLQEEQLILRIADPQLAERVRRALREEESLTEGLSLSFPGVHMQHHRCVCTLCIRSTCAAHAAHAGACALHRVGAAGSADG